MYCDYCGKEIIKGFYLDLYDNVVCPECNSNPINVFYHSVDFALEKYKDYHKFFMEIKDGIINDKERNEILKTINKVINKLEE